jgi:hypothetical protein
MVTEFSNEMSITRELENTARLLMEVLILICYYS